MSIYLIGEGTNLGIYQASFRTIFDGGRIGGAGLRAIQQNAGKDLYAVLADGRLAKWGGTAWAPFSLICGRRLRSLAFDSSGLLWCVSEAGKIVTVDADGENCKELDRPWTLKMVTFDGAGTLWAIGEAGNLASWNATTSNWSVKKQPWELKMIAYDDQQTLWGVGAAGNVAKWVNDTWVVQNIPWNSEWLAFLKADGEPNG
ncbi:YCF48-related protein [Nannocystis sp. SCPEA4]|uniref:YCF48-related protein n=1 Tax=Nannocystis sp. SCPEA4 TaxID=2996787 RepID=UPI0022700075|nr:YCF48-related protein [Nannocystis sp. SCPEA4]MCY1060289.1 YCF48-related protein [Nannocystis sp. SCPEA4]